MRTLTTPMIKRMRTPSAVAAVFAIAVAAAGSAIGQQAPAPAPAQPPPAQTPAPPAAPAGQGRGAGAGGAAGGNPFAASYPQRPPGDPAAIERGKVVWEANCAFCHGRDARGGDSGPSLLRSQLVLNDQFGELMTPVVQNGRIERGMPKFDLTAAQITDIAAFVHSFRVGGYDVSRERPTNIVVGSAEAGEAAFKARCASCHSVTGDLKGFGGKFMDARQLQQTWLMPAAGGGRGGGPSLTNVPPTTVTVTLASGQKVEGRLGRIDEFLVTLVQDDGTSRSFRREGAAPKVEIHDPLEPHKALLSKYTDKEIHDITAYLVTIK